MGDTDKDRVLTQARAKVVRDYVVQHFKVDDTRVKIIGLGKSPKAGETSKIEILYLLLEVSQGVKRNPASPSFPACPLVG
jgi:hypothetical protein